MFLWNRICNKINMFLLTHENILLISMLIIWNIKTNIHASNGYLTYTERTRNETLNNVCCFKTILTKKEEE